MWRLILMGAAGLLLNGCATRGAIRLDCPDFANYAYSLPKSRLLQDIQGDVPTGEVISTSSLEEPQDPLSKSLRNGVKPVAAEDRPGTLSVDEPPRRDVLLLSGGGQWGAFGVGFLTELRAHKPAAFPHAQTITGVSTGALQALFLGVGNQDAFDAMNIHYAPDVESDVVNRNPQLLAAVTGSMAGLKPLRRKLLKALCKSKGGDPCPMITLLAREEAPDVFIGFVDAVTGDFRYVAVKELARLKSRSEAQQCIAGAAMASVAMPVFFQQVRVGKKDEERVYYDGGVRQSVFEAEVARKAEYALQAAVAQWDGDRKQAALQGKPFLDAKPTPPTIYVLRNGPTTVSRAEGAFGPGPDALSNALRAESIVVNQLEVQSIADLRLAHPSGPILLITADGWNNWAEKCDKPKGVMFAPDFMKCLTRFGTARAQRDPPWRNLSQILPGQTAADLRVGP